MTATPSLDAVLAEIDDSLHDATERLFELLRVPSISTDPAYAEECDTAADWLVFELQNMGIDAQKRPTPGHPMVTGKVEGPEGSPHLLFYGHYDVQPVDPLELWNSKPFDPKIEETPGGKVIRARGAGDDKGQLMTFVGACHAWKKVYGSFPCTITFFFEGEEESGSPSLIPFMQEHKDELTADIALICDTAMFNKQTPAIVTMLRGMLGEEITIRGADKDLHSGMFGGIAMNPIRVLTRILAELHDDQGRVTVPGFYEGVPEIDPEIMDQWKALGFDETAFLKSVGLEHAAGEAGRSGLEMIWSRPTCEVNGIWGGYTGAGFKTVLPAEAHAKISFRLVGTQDPVKIRESFREMVEGMLPDDLSVEFKDHSCSQASVMSTEDPMFEKARAALSLEWPRPAAFIGSGGSIPIAGLFKSITGMDSMLIGFGQDDDQIHSPNEKYDLNSFHRGMRSWARVLDALSRP